MSDGTADGGSMPPHHDSTPHSTSRAKAAHEATELHVIACYLLVVMVVVGVLLSCRTRAYMRKRFASPFQRWAPLSAATAIQRWHSIAGLFRRVPDDSLNIPARLLSWALELAFSVCAAIALVALGHADYRKSSSGLRAIYFQLGFVVSVGIVLCHFGIVLPVLQSALSSSSRRLHRLGQIAAITTFCFFLTASVILALVPLRKVNESLAHSHRSSSERLLATHILAIEGCALLLWHLALEPASALFLYYVLGVTRHRLVSTSHPASVAAAAAATSSRPTARPHSSSHKQLHEHSSADLFSGSLSGGDFTSGPSATASTTHVFSAASMQLESAHMTQSTLRGGLLSPLSGSLSGIASAYSSEHSTSDRTSDIDSTASSARSSSEHSAAASSGTTVASQETATASSVTASASPRAAADLPPPSPARRSIALDRLEAKLADSDSPSEYSQYDSSGLLAPSSVSGTPPPAALWANVLQSLMRGSDSESKFDESATTNPFASLSASGASFLSNAPSGTSLGGSMPRPLDRPRRSRHHGDADAHDESHAAYLGAGLCLPVATVLVGPSSEQPSDTLSPQNSAHCIPVPDLATDSALRLAPLPRGVSRADLQ